MGSLVYLIGRLGQALDAGPRAVGVHFIVEEVLVIVRVQMSGGGPLKSVSSMVASGCPSGCRLSSRKQFKRTRDGRA